MKKRFWMKSAAVMAMLPQAGWAQQAEESPQRPNIVFILADDMGYGDIASFNYGASRTPAIDRLIREGTVLTQHYTGSAVCTPSRACLMTGRYPHRTGAVDTQAIYGLENLSLKERTIADELRAAGYVTGIVGKWHLGWDDPCYRPQNRGFSETVALEKTHHWDWIIDRNGHREISDGRYLADVLTDEAITFIRRHREEPFFLYLAHFEPHTPLLAPEEDIQPFRDDGFDENISTLYGMIYRMDRGIGRVLDELKALGLEENTLVVFTSDNGPQFGTAWTEQNTIRRYNCGLAGHKDTVYEGGIRVPAVVRWPAGLPVRGLQYVPTHFADWFPTLLDVAGVAVPENLSLDGHSLLPMLRDGKELPEFIRCWQFSRYYPSGQHNAAIRIGDWKLIRPALPYDVTGPVFGVLPPRGIATVPECFNPGVRYIPQKPAPNKPQLFNLKADPLEQFDLSTEYPERVQQMEQALNQWFDSVMKDYRLSSPTR